MSGWSLGAPKAPADRGMQPAANGVEDSPFEQLVPQAG
jgi:hypothetical protein